MSTRARDMRSPCLHAALFAFAFAFAGGHAHQQINRCVVGAAMRARADCAPRPRRRIKGAAAVAVFSAASSVVRLRL